MGTLAERLRKELRNWRTQLPLAWRRELDGVELDFDAVDPSADLRSDERIWPQAGAGPRGAHLFKAFKDLPPSKVRVVIFGNDPYTKLAQATGRSFEQGDLADWGKDLKARRVSPSLMSIIAAALATRSSAKADGLVGPSAHAAVRRLATDGGLPLPPPNCVFKHWAKQGVLWLNRTLTFSKWDDSHRSSHTGVWAPFTRRVLEILASKDGVVFVLWGGKAKDLKAPIRVLRRQAGLPAQGARFVEAGHPQRPVGFFTSGNPLAAIDAALDGIGGGLRWS